MGIWFTTRETVMRATDIKSTALSSADVDQDIEAGARDVEALVRRIFYPYNATMTFDWPGQFTNTYRLYLGRHDLQSVSAITSAGAAVTNYLLRPDDGPPYRRVELSRNLAPGAWSQQGTFQRAISITGLWGYCNTFRPAGALAASMSGSATAITCTDSSLIGVGQLLTIGTERLTVAGKALTTTGTVTAGSDLTAKASNTTVPVVDGTKVLAGERISIDAEVMHVSAVTGNDLTVVRAMDGSTLAAHTSGTTVYAPRALTVVRGVTGTTAAAVNSATAITAWVPPGPVEALNIAYAVRAGVRRDGGFSESIDQQTRKDAETPINKLEDRIAQTYGRIRSAAV